MSRNEEDGQRSIVVREPNTEIIPQLHPRPFGLWMIPFPLIREWLENKLRGEVQILQRPLLVHHDEPPASLVTRILDWLRANRRALLRIFGALVFYGISVNNWNIRPGLRRFIVAMIEFGFFFFYSAVGVVEFIEEDQRRTFQVAIHVAHVAAAVWILINPNLSFEPLSVFIPIIVVFFEVFKIISQSIN